jgi:parvulin-like peptidyl-prolyl isomerase
MNSSALRNAMMIALASSLALGAAAVDPTDTDVVAHGKGVEITVKELNTAYERLHTSMINAGTLPAPEAVEAFRAQLLNRMVVMRLCEARATEVDRKRAQFESNALIEGMRNQANSPEDFEKQLAREGHTFATFRQDRFQETLANTVVDRELKATLKPSPEELRKRYDETPERWTIPETVKIAQLLISTRNPNTGEDLSEETRKQRRQVIQDLRTRAEKGEDFSILIRQHSEDSNSKARRGEYVFARGQMLLEIEAAAFSLKPGQLSDVVTTQFGYHVLRLLERTPEKKRSFEEVESVLKAQWLSEELSRRLPEYLQKIRTDAGIELTAIAPKIASPAGTETIPRR